MRPAFSFSDKALRSLRSLLQFLARQPRYRLITGFVVFLLLVGAFSGRRATQPEVEIGVPYAGPRNAANKASDENFGFLPLHEATDFCGRRRWDIYTARDQRRKIYDMFLINTELDWLDIRLHDLNSEVDYFIILESNITFQAQEKPLHLQANLDDSRRPWGKYRSQIIHRIADFSQAKLDVDDTWEHERFTRNALFDQALRSLSGEQAPQQGDILLVSDVDEIPRKNTLQALRNCAFPPRVTLRSHFYYYSFQWLHRGEQWHHPQATYFNGFEQTVKPEDLRSNKPHTELFNAAWHCSSCFPSMADMKNKITSFSHKGYNQPYFLDETRLLQNVRMGRDMFERETEIFDRVDANLDVPEYLKGEGKGRFEYLLDRDPPNANFADVDMNEGLGLRSLAENLNGDVMDAESL